MRSRVPGRPDQRDARLRAGRAVSLAAVAQRDDVRGEVDAVVGVQVRDDDRVDVGGFDVALQRAERTVTQVEDEPVAVLLDQVARRRRVRARACCRSSRGR